MNKKGVTLIELIVVFVIIAIAAGLIAPNISGWLPRYRLRSATRDIVSTIRTAQMKAVSSRLQYRVSFNSGDTHVADNTGYILQLNSGGFVNEGGVQTLPPGITIATNTLTDLRAIFNSDFTSSSGSITLNQKKGGTVQATKAIILNAATGRITIQ